MAADMFLEPKGVAGKSKVRKHPKAIMSFLVRYKGASGLSSMRIDGHHHHSRWAEREAFTMKRVLVFALEAATGAATCAGSILAIFAWSGTSL
jgi:hypothetical protein